MSETLQDLATRYWNRVLRENPVLATFYGVHDHDARIDDLSAESESLFRSDLAEIRRSVDALATATLDKPSLVTRSLLLSQIDQRIQAIDLRLAELRSDHMDGPHAQLLMAAPLLTYPQPEHAEACLDRYSAIPRMLGQASERFRAGLAHGRTPVAAVIARSINSLDLYLASDIDDDPLLAASVPQDWAGRQQWLTRATDIVVEQVRPAFEIYRNFLRDELLPVGRDADHAGLCWLPDGEEIYSALIHSYTSTHLSASELHTTGERIITQQLSGEYIAIARDWFASLDHSHPALPNIDGPELAELFEFIRTSPLLRHRDAEEILATATESIRRATESIPQWFGHLPEAECVVEPVPDFMSADAPYAYYFPAAPDGTRPGTYFINTASPEEASLAEAESIAFHEAIPGHHLQIAIGSEMDSIPEFQRHEGNTAFIEGWALYAERLADEMGLYSDHASRIGMLTADSWRSARLVVDTGLHASGWSRDRAIAYFSEHTPVPVDQIAAEVDRYIAIPGQALSYKVGQLEIERLRSLAEDTLGSRFDIRAFHDAVLGSGAVTLPVLGDIVDAYIAAGS